MTGSFIQIIGTQRSGSNLLRVMLNAHPQISAPHPPHMLDAFYPLISAYGDLNQNASLFSLCRDIAAFVRANRVPWQVAEPSAEALMENCLEPNLIGVVHAVYRFRMKREEKKFWCCKSLANYKYHHALEQSQELPFYIHLVRDGRAVAHSFMKSPVGDKHPYVIGENWNRDQQACVNIEKQVPPKRFYRLHYEALITDTRNQLEKLCEALGLSFHENMLHYFETGEAIQTADSGPLWTNLKLQPIAGKIQSGQLLNADELHFFECAAQEMLLHLGYGPIHYADKKCPTSDQLAAIQELNTELCRKAGSKPSLSEEQIHLLKSIQLKSS